MRNFTKLKKVLYLILIFQILLAGFPLRTFAYPAYTANSDLVVAGPYDTAVSGTGNWSCASGCVTPSYREFITVGQKYRIRQTGTISQIKIYTASVTSLTGFYIKIWRKNGSAYDLVGTSNNLASSLIAGNYTTINLSSPITGVQEGDFYGYRIEASDDTQHFFARTSVTGVTSYYINGVTPSVTSYAWESVPNQALTGSVLPIELYMTAPQVAFIGDSIIAGHPAHYSFLETTATTSINSTIERQFGNLTGYTYQNMGIGSQTTSGISTRFAADIINLKPKVVVIEGGVNDIAGDVTKSTFIANWTSMLDLAQADSNITTVIVLKILPWTNGTNVQMQTRDDWNASLTTLAAGYSKAVVVDASSYVGQFRAGGDAENLWNIQTAYNQDGVHFNQAGHTQIAQAIVDHLPLTMSSVSPADGATLIAADANLVITFDRPAYPQAGAQNDITIKKASNNAVVETIDAQSAQVSGSGTNTITINPSVTLDVATNYYIQISADAFDDATGNSFAGISNATTWNFMTIDITNPTIYTLSPADYSTDVDINSNLVITFSEPVDAKTGNVVIKKTSDDSTFETIPVTSGNVTGSGTDTITVDPVKNFDQGTDYYIQIDATAFDDATGNSFAGISNATTWNFTSASFAYRKQITINNENIDATLTDFPLQVHLSADLDIGLVTRSDGYDILFTTSDGQLLSYERESWSGGGGSAATADFWVKTTLNADNNVATNDIIYIYYGKADATDGSHVPDSTSNDVWNSTFAGVWHLDEVVTDEGTSGIHADSVYNGNNGTQQGNVNIGGPISNAQQFDGNDTITINKAYTSSDISVSWWGKSAVSSPTAQGLFDVNRGSDRLFAYQWNLNTNGAYVLYKDSSTALLYKRGLDASITQTDWHYYTAVWSETAKTFVIYLNGVAQSLVNTGVPSDPSTSTTRLGIAALNGAVSIDEFRISSVAESAAWIKFEYSNMADAANDLTFGEQQNVTYAITTSAGNNGSITPSGATTINSGGDQTITITPNANYHVADVLVDSESIGAVSSYDFTNVTTDHTISATFAINSYALTYAAGANGSITGTNPQTVNYGADGSAVTAVADSGYHFVNWSDSLTTNPRTDTNVTGDISVTANFAVTSSGGGGCYGCYVNPVMPNGGFKISINGGVSTTSNRNVFLGFNAGTDIKKIAISMTGDFIDASQENYIASKQWDLCSKLGGAIKNPTCSDGQYTVYVKFYTAYGRTSGNAFASSTITLKSDSTPTENLQQINNLPFTNPFSKYLQYRQTNADIKRLQIFLNSDPDTKVSDLGAGSPSKETNYFGILTYRAVIKFQEKYAKDVLAPWGFVKGTGYVGKTTLAKINELIGNK